MTYDVPEDVSRETSDLLHAYAKLLLRWNRSINLISTKTTEDIFQRHIIDSLETVNLTRKTSGTWADFGSGGGFPGIVAAIVQKNSRAITLIESDKRKSVFLRTVSRELNLPFDVVSNRVESIPPLRPGTITARALAPLAQLLDLSLHHMTPETELIFPKGKNWQQEVEQAQTQFAFQLETYPSITQEGSVNLYIKDLQRHAT